MRDARTDVDCVEAATEVTIDDQQCLDRTTGTLATGCVSVERVTVAAAGGSAVVTVFTDPSGVGGTDPEVTISLFTEEGPVLVECGTEGCTGFYGPGFANFDVGMPITITTTSGDGFWTFSGVPVRNDGPDAVLDVPSGDLLGGSGTVPGGPSPLADVNLFVQAGDLQSTTLLSLTAFGDALEE